MIFLICILSFAFFSNAQEIRIGALFDQSDLFNVTEQIFNTAIAAVNNDNNAYNFKLEAVINEIPYGNELLLSKTLCRMFKRGGISAVFGPSSTLTSRHAINICDTKEIPYIDTRWDVNTKPPVINMHPHPHVIAELIYDLVKAFEWEGFTILYESASWLPRLSKLLKMNDPKGNTITVRKIDLGLDSENSFRSVLRQVRLSEDNHIVLDCSLELLTDVLTQIQQVGLMTEHYQFIITTLDIDTIDLEPFKYSDANITGIRVINPENPILEEIRKHLNPAEPEPEHRHHIIYNDNNNNGEGEHEHEHEEDSAPPPALKITLQNALLYDGVLLLTEAFKQLDYELVKQKRLDCANDVSWENGDSITNFMRNTVVNGLTGEIKFDNQGIRSSITADIIELGWAGVTKVGTWNSTMDESNRLVITRKYEKTVDIEDGTLRNKTFKVITALTEPYGMLKDSALRLTGNDRFEGYGIDLIHALSQMLGFHYEFLLQEDGVYGNIENGSWSGMIGKLISREADLAITDLTITAERESGVDFTMPFMNLGISILYKKPTKEPPSTFSFMSPFSTEVWIYLGAAYVGVSLCLFILGRLSPSEWDNPYPCIEQPTHLENQFTLRNSLWFTIGALLQQGSEIAPKAPSTRAVASIWWFFTLIMVSSYTANLAAFLTVESVSSPFKSADDLKVCGDSSNACPVTFGAKYGGSTYKFFEEADQGTYKQMFMYMHSHPEFLPKDNKQGLEWSKTKNYAFLMESSSIEYITERHCELRQVGGLLDDKGYGIAMRKNSSYRSALSEGVLKLQEAGELTKLKDKWWTEKKGGGSCSAETGEGVALALEFANVEGIFLLLMVGVIVAALVNVIEYVFQIKMHATENKKKESSEAQELAMENMFGIFIVLFMGSAFASGYGCLEWLILLYKKSKKYKVPFKDELIAELKFLVKCKGNTKTVRYRKNSSEESNHSSNTYRSNSKHSDI